MKKLLLVICMTLSLYGNNYDKELENLSPEQHRVFEKVWKIGKELGLEYTLTAIAWQESNFGKYKIGKWSPDYGVFQININTYKKRYSKVIKKLNIPHKTIVKMLTHDFEIGLVAAVDELLFWKKVRKGDWYKVWASYNDGGTIGKKGHKYATSILRRVKAIKRYKKNREKILENGCV